MQDLKVTLVQTTQFWEDKISNLKHFDELIASIEDTDLIVLPEMFHTAFSMRAKDLAEPMEDSAAMHWLSAKAKLKSCAIYTSFIAKEGEKYYNRGIFILPSGEFTIYDKRKLFSLAGEDKIYSAGEEKVIVNYKGWKILLQICYDLRFPENQRNQLDEYGVPLYDIMLTVANWPERRIHHWKTLLAARAIENQCFVVGVNRVGLDGNGLNYSGDSKVFDALGDSFPTFEAGQTSYIKVILNKENLDEVRLRLAFLKDVFC